MCVNRTFRCFGILVWLMVVTAAQKCRDDQTLRTWKQANASCRLYTPLQLSVRLGVNLNNKVVLNRNLKSWIGYVKLHHDFEYLGCTSVWNITALPTSNTPYPSPGKCFSECHGFRFFGIGYKRTNDWRCYCLSGRPLKYTYNDAFCTTPCYEDTGIPCGGQQCYGGNQCLEYVSLYREIGISTSHDDACRSYDPVIKTYVWERCLQYQYAMCTGHRSDWVSTNMLQWNMSVNICFKQHRYPTYNFTDPPTKSHQNYDGHRIWTSVFRSFVIHQASDVPITGLSRMQYGFLQYSPYNDIFYMYFTENNSDIGLSLCYPGTCSSFGTHITSKPTTITSTTTTTPTTTTPTTITTTPTTSSTTQTNTPIIATATTPSTTIGTTSTATNRNTIQVLIKASPQLDTDTDRLAGASNNTKVGSYIGVTIGILALLLLVGGVVILLRRRRKPPPKEGTVGNATSNDAYSEPVTPVNHTSTSQHVYFNNQAMENENNSKSAVCEFPADDEEYTYIRADNMNQSGDHQGQYVQNVYHVLEKERHPDQLHGKTNVAFTQNSDGYDVSGMYPNDALTSSNVYNTTNYGGSANNDDYDVSRTFPNEVSTSDNVYNTTNFGDNVHNDEYDVSGNVPSKRNESHDVYNHTSHESIDVDDTYNHTSGNTGNQGSHGKRNNDVYSTTTIT